MEYDHINPNHYKGSKEVIEMMVDIWGNEKVSTYCEINAFKYRMRLGKKPDQPVERDLEKAKWYEAKAKELREDAENDGAYDPFDKAAESFAKNIDRCIADPLKYKFRGAEWLCQNFVSEETDDCGQVK